MALVYETLKFYSVLQQILTASNLQSLEKSLKDVHLTKVLVYDALFGQGIEGNGKKKVSPSLMFLTYLFIVDHSFK